MKKIKFILLVVVGIIVCSCSNDFLLENFRNNNGPIFSDTLYLKDIRTSQNITLTIPENLINLNAAYKIRQYPGWVKINKITGNLNGNKLALTFDPSSKYYSTNLWGEVIVEIEGCGLIQIAITNAETSGTKETDNMTVTPTIISFGESLNSATLGITNTGNSAIQYHITSYPQWISINSQDLNGTLSYNYSSKQITLTCNRLSTLSDGNYDGKIIISNNLLDTISVIVRMTIPKLVNASNVSAIEGNVVDAVFDKSSNKLYVVTQSPNQLIVQDGSTNTTQIITLTKTPGTIKLSENGSLIFVGQNHLLTVFDAGTLTIRKSIEVTIDVFDMMYGENNWCYLVAKSTGLDTSSDGSRYVNIVTGYSFIPTFNTYNYYQVIDQSAHITKVRNKDLAIVTRTSTSPQGLYLFQLKNDSLKIVKYWHESTGVRYWSAEDGSFVLGAGGYCIEPTSIGSGTLNVLAQLSPDATSSSYYNYKWFDHCKSSESIWGIYGAGSSYDAAKVIEFDANTFLKKRTVNYTVNYVANVNGVVGQYESEPYYVFSNKSGNKIFLIKNLKTKYNASSWSIETVDLNR